MKKIFLVLLLSLLVIGPVRVSALFEVGNDQKNRTGLTEKTTEQCTQRKRNAATQRRVLDSPSNPNNGTLLEKVSSSTTTTTIDDEPDPNQPQKPAVRNPNDNRVPESKNQHMNKITESNPTPSPLETRALSPSPLSANDDSAPVASNIGTLEEHALTPISEPQSLYPRSVRGDGSGVHQSREAMAPSFTSIDEGLPIINGVSPELVSPWFNTEDEGEKADIFTQMVQDISFFNRSQMTLEEQNALPERLLQIEEEHDVENVTRSNSKIKAARIGVSKKKSAFGTDRDFWNKEVSEKIKNAQNDATALTEELKKNQRPKTRKNPVNSISKPSDPHPTESTAIITRRAAFLGESTPIANVTNYGATDHVMARKPQINDPEVPVNFFDSFEAPTMQLSSNRREREEEKVPLIQEAAKISGESSQHSFIDAFPTENGVFASKESAKAFYLRKKAEAEKCSDLAMSDHGKAWFMLSAHDWKRAYDYADSNDSEVSRDYSEAALRDTKEAHSAEVNFLIHKLEVQKKSIDVRDNRLLASFYQKAAEAARYKKESIERNDSISTRLWNDIVQEYLAVITALESDNDEEALTHSERAKRLKEQVSNLPSARLPSARKKKICHPSNCTIS